MTAARQVLDIARGQIGTVEDTHGRQPYGAWYGADGVAWCAIFVAWCFHQAGAGQLIHPRTAYTPTLAQWFRDRGAFDTTPRPGDLVFYNWPDGVDRIQHVGLVEAVEPASIVTIEGNTSSGVVGSQSNGGGVWRRRRARNASVVGYGHPAYTAPAAARTEENPMPLSPQDLDAIAERVWGRLTKNAFGDTVRADQILVGTEDRVTKTQDRVGELAALVQQLRAGGVDPAVIDRAVRDALGHGLTVTSTVAPTP